MGRVAPTAHFAFLSSWRPRSLPVVEGARRRPLSWVVRPPCDHGTSWSISQSAAGTPQKGWNVLGFGTRAIPVDRSSHRSNARVPASQVGTAQEALWQMADFRF